MWIKMRFIGSKKNIVGKIEEVLNKHTDGSEKKQEKQLYDLLADCKIKLNTSFKY